MATLPIHYTGAYLTHHGNPGIPGGWGDGSVLSVLANPPATAVAAEAANEAAAEAVGVNSPNTDARLNATRQRDSIKEFYDSASVLRVPED